MNRMSRDAYHESRLFLPKLVMSSESSYVSVSKMRLEPREDENEPKIGTKVNTNQDSNEESKVLCQIEGSNLGF